MSTYYFSVGERININTQKSFNKVYQKIIHPEDRVVGLFDSYGGSASVASRIVEKIVPLSEPGLISFVAIGGEKIFSAAAFIYSVFNERLAFEDSHFLIHPSIPPKGKERDSLYDVFDLQVWGYMSASLDKISTEELRELALQNRIIGVSEALRIGLVHRVLEGSSRDKEKILRREGLLL